MKLDMHCEMILDEYRDRLPILNKQKDVVLDILKRTLLMSRRTIDKG